MKKLIIIVMLCVAPTAIISVHTQGNNHGYVNIN